MEEKKISGKPESRILFTYLNLSGPLKERIDRHVATIEKNIEFSSGLEKDRLEEELKQLKASPLQYFKNKQEKIAEDLTKQKAKGEPNKFLVDQHSDIMAIIDGLMGGSLVNKEKESKIIGKEKDLKEVEAHIDSLTSEVGELVAKREKIGRGSSNDPSNFDKINALTEERDRLQENLEKRRAELEQAKESFSKVEIKQEAKKEGPIDLELTQKKEELRKLFEERHKTRLEPISNDVLKRDEEISNKIEELQNLIQKMETGEGIKKIESMEAPLSIPHKEVPRAPEVEDKKEEPLAEKPKEEPVVWDFGGEDVLGERKKIEKIEKVEEVKKEKLPETEITPEVWEKYRSKWTTEEPKGKGIQEGEEIVKKGFFSDVSKTLTKAEADLAAQQKELAENRKVEAELEKNENEQKLLAKITIGTKISYFDRSELHTVKELPSKENNFRYVIEYDLEGKVAENKIKPEMLAGLFASGRASLAGEKKEEQKPEQIEEKESSAEKPEEPEPQTEPEEKSKQDLDQQKQDVKDYVNTYSEKDIDEKNPESVKFQKIETLEAGEGEIKVDEIKIESLKNLRQQQIEKIEQKMKDLEEEIIKVKERILKRKLLIENLSKQVEVQKKISDIKKMGSFGFH